VNAEHFKTFVWLRWRLFVNQMRRGGIANVVVVTLLAVGGIALAAAMFVIFFVLGLFALDDVPSAALMYVWDGVIVAFLFSWMMGLMIELQRAEVLSLDKFLHHPVSLRGAFVINYLSSLVSVSTLLFLPAMFALALGLVFSRGAAMLLVLPLLAAFVLMVTAVTYQFQGWLAALMVNPRRRRTVIVVVTLVFILVCQLPNLVNIVQPWENKQARALQAEKDQKETELRQSMNRGDITLQEFSKRLTEIEKEYSARIAEVTNQSSGLMTDTAWLLNVALPPGWLALGAKYAADGNILIPLLVTAGLTLIGTFSLWRSYVTTVRLYTGQFSSGKRAPAAVAAPSRAGPPRSNLLERQLPWVSEQASVIAFGTFRGLVRAPEAKMMLLTPVIMVLVFGSIFLAQSVTPSESVRPLMVYGAMTMSLFSGGQLLLNQFGFDRGGFRVFVLSAAPRRDILLGKNLAFAPIVIALALSMVILVEVVYPMRVDYLLAALPQLVSMYLVFCMLANWLSIFAPMPIRAGSFRPANPKLVPVLLQMLFLTLLPLGLAPILLPLGIELALEGLGVVKGWPICLALSLVVCAAAVFLYRVMLKWQGSVLQAFEMKILETVTTKTE
jgi:hypothetical protein